jgi:Flp pilus assembly protein TadG
MVEFALITPVFFLVFFGILEFALITASIGSFNFASREGALTGSIYGRSSANGDPDQAIVTAVRNHVQGVVMAKGQEVDIYKADPNNGSCLTSGGSDIGVGTFGCLEDQYQLNGQPLTGGSMSWPVANRNDTLLNADYVGVRVVYQYTYVTGFIGGLGSTLTLSTYSVQRIEPQDYNG